MSSRFYKAKEQLEKITRLRAQGLSDADIAERLGISKHTIRAILPREKPEAQS